MNVYQYTDADLDRLANHVKEALIADLANEGHLDIENQQEYEEFCASMVVVLARKGMFGHFWDKVRGITDNTGYRIVVMHSKVSKPGPGAEVIRLVKDE